MNTATALAQWVWGQPQATPLVLVGATLALLLVLHSYRSCPGPRGGKLMAASLKAAALVALALCLLEPQWSHERAVPGENELLLLVDSSASLGITDAGEQRPRGERLLESLNPEQAWQVRAGQDFRLSRFTFAERLRSMQDLSAMEFNGRRSSLPSSLQRLGERGQGRAVAGIVLFSDGNLTEAFAQDYPWAMLPPIYPVVVGSGEGLVDVSVDAITTTQTPFEQSPVQVGATIVTRGLEDQPLEVCLRDQEGQVLDRRRLSAGPEGEALAVRFEAPAASSGVHFFSVEARPLEGVRQATEMNDRRWAVVDRGQGPYRILYVSGRPNWEFKFLRRAADEDPELELVGLLRIARRQPKFTFRDREDSRNSLFDGFSEAEADVAEQYDEPVLLRLGTRDEFELREGFPRTAEALFDYDALLIDDLEAAFFTADQMSLIEQFVARRGGGLLAMGGEESFLKGGYRRTPVGDLLPVSLENAPALDFDEDFRLQLSREGWLAPWVRLRPTEVEEQQRLTEMPGFRTVNRVGALKAGASLLLTARDGDDLRPGLAVHRYGRGRAAALMFADLWRWDLAREEGARSDLGTAWRQTLRWLVSDVPRRLQIDSRVEDSQVEIRVVLRNPEHQAEDNASLTLEVQPAEGEKFSAELTPSSEEAGVWTARMPLRQPGPHRAVVRATLADGSSLGSAETGWVGESAAQELRRLAPDRERMEDIAARTGGQLVELQELEDFVAGLPDLEMPVSERVLEPLWHQWWVFLLAIALLCGEWAWRRTRGWA